MCCTGLDGSLLRTDSWYVSECLVRLDRLLYGYGIVRMRVAIPGTL